MTMAKLNGVSVTLVEELRGEVKRMGVALGEVRLELAVLRTEFDDLKKTVSFRPKSQRAMTEEDARRVVLGDLRTVPSKQAAVTMGLSYGQVYSARNGYTFKEVYDEKERSEQRKREEAIIREVMEPKG